MAVLAPVAANIQKDALAAPLRLGDRRLNIRSCIPLAIEFLYRDARGIRRA